MGDHLMKLRMILPLLALLLAAGCARHVPAPAPAPEPAPAAPPSKGEKGPTLVALDPATGAETYLGPMPVDIQEARLSPDGKWAVLTALDPDADFRHHVYVVEAATGKATKLDAAGLVWRLQAAWNDGKVAIPMGATVLSHDLGTGKTEKRTSQADNWGAVSPDHRYLFGFKVAEVKENRMALTLVLHDAATGTERVVSSAVHIPKPFHAPMTINHVWGPGGLLLWDALEVDENRNVKQQRTVKLDHRKGSLAPTDEVLRRPVRDAWVTGPGGWQFASSITADWGPVKVRKSDGTGEAAWGTGYALGWRPDGRLLVVRWADSASRRSPPGP